MNSEHEDVNVLVSNLPTAAAGGQLPVPVHAVSEPGGISTLSQGGLVLLATLVGVASMLIGRTPCFAKWAPFVTNASSNGYHAFSNQTSLMTEMPCQC